MRSNKRMHLNDKWLMLYFSVSKQRKPHEQHKAAGGSETQQYPVLTGSDLSNGSGARGNRIAAAGQFYSITTLQCFIRNASITKHASYCINAHRRVPAAMPLYV